MADLSRRPGNRTTRSQRVQRGHNLVLTAGGAGAIAVVTGILALVGVIGWGIPLLALVVAVIAAVLFRRMVTPR
jgi:hypothetical protein